MRNIPRAWVLGAWGPALTVLVCMYSGDAAASVACCCGEVIIAVIHIGLQLPCMCPFDNFEEEAVGPRAGGAWRSVGHGVPLQVRQGCGRGLPKYTPLISLTPTLMPCCRLLVIGLAVQPPVDQGLHARWSGCPSTALAASQLYKDRPP